MTTQAVAAIYGSLVGGVLAMIGVLAGMALERRLQSRGKLRCIVSDWELMDVGSLGQAFCSFEVYLFNERILATGLRDVSVVFYRDGEQGWGYLLKDRASSERLRVIDLPPAVGARETVRLVRGKCSARAHRAPASCTGRSPTRWQ